MEGSLFFNIKPKCKYDAILFFSVLQNIDLAAGARFFHNSMIKSVLMYEAENWSL